MTTIHAFLPTARPHAAVVNLTSGGATVPPALAPGLSSYAASKFAAIKVFEYVSAENPDIFVASLHPGFVDTATFQKSGSRADLLPMDTGELAPILYSERLVAMVVLC